MIFMTSLLLKSVVKPPAAVPKLVVEQFETTYDAEFGYVWKTLERLGAPSRDVEDLAQEVFVVALRRWADYDKSRAVRPWLFGIAYRVLADWRRLGRNSREFLHDDETGPQAVTAACGDEQVLQNEQRALVRAALGKLDMDRKSVFIMHEIDGHGMPQIAEALGVPLNTAYSRLRLARADFAAAVESLASKKGEHDA